MKDTKEIRKLLKEKLGYNARQVSVRSPNYSSIEFTIRDATVDIQKVEDFSKTFENISYDEASGEILEGGNTFVFVYLSEEVKETLANKYLPLVDKAIEEAKKEGNENHLFQIGETPFKLSLRGSAIILWENGFVTEAYSSKAIAILLGQSLR